MRRGNFRTWTDMEAERLTPHEWDKLWVSDGQRAYPVPARKFRVPLSLVWCFDEHGEISSDPEDLIRDIVRLIP